jgi:N-acetylmuramoyl-L-alanine amidase
MFKRLIGTVIIAVSMFALVSPTFAYTVKAGDTMYAIAKTNNITLDKLVSLNPTIKDPNLIFIGENVNTIENNSVTTSETYTAAELDLMARLVRAEAQGESFQGKVAVAEVILNRIHSPLFPDTVQEVIYQKGQFSPVSNGAINLPADTDSINAVKEAVNNGTNLDGALFFYNPRTATSRWLDSKPVLLVIGNHEFK